MTAKAKFRYYERENESEEVDFPGYVRTDAVWEDVPIATERLVMRRLQRNRL